MKHTSNVLVVGGGPAGATAARLLAQHGLETLMLEKDLSFGERKMLDIARNLLVKEISLAEEIEDVQAEGVLPDLDHFGVQRFSR